MDLDQHLSNYCTFDASNITVPAVKENYIFKENVAYSLAILVLGKQECSIQPIYIKSDLHNFFT